MVTGGWGGIGTAIANELAHLGCTVVLAARSEEKLKLAVESLRSKGGSVDYIVCNIRREDEVCVCMCMYVYVCECVFMCN